MKWWEKKVYHKSLSILRNILRVYHWSYYYTIPLTKKRKNYFNGILLGIHGGHRIYEDVTTKTTQPNDHVQQECGDMPKGWATVFHVPYWWHEGKVASHRNKDPDKTNTVSSDTGRRDIITARDVLKSEQLLKINRHE